MKFKVSASQQTQADLKELWMLKTNLNAMGERYELIRDKVKSEFPEGVAAGEFVFSTTKCTRKNLDRKQLEMDLGPEVISKYEKETSYIKIDIKKVG